LKSDKIDLKKKLSKLIVRKLKDDAMKFKE